jgi:predicted acetyltransferase
MDLRPVTEDELPDFIRVDYTGFGVELSQDHDEAEMLELDRTLAAFDGGRMVGTAAAFSFELTLPGLTSVPAAGVTWVAVLPTHRRRGVLRAMMTRQLDEIPEPVAILGASEAPIYGRFGYGLASVGHMVHVDPRRSEFREPLVDDGRVVLVDADTAAKVLPDVFDRSRRITPGDHQRSDAWWSYWFKDKEHWREGATSRFYVVHEDGSGQADGFAAYRLKSGWDDHGVPNGEMTVESLVSVTPTARAALWRYLLDVDLMTVVKTQWVAPDDPLRLLLADPRAARVTGVVDDLWVRLLDIPAALSARGYATDGRLVLDVVDELRPQTGGRFALDGGECRRTDGDPDLTLAVADLGSLYLGGVGAGALHRAGRITEHRPGAVALADTMFRSDPLPFNQTEF